MGMFFVRRVALERGLAMMPGAAGIRPGSRFAHGRYARHQHEYRHHRLHFCQPSERIGFMAAEALAN